MTVIEASIARGVTDRAKRHKHKAASATLGGDILMACEKKSKEKRKKNKKKKEKEKRKRRNERKRKEERKGKERNEMKKRRNKDTKIEKQQDNETRGIWWMGLMAEGENEKMKKNQPIESEQRKTLGKKKCENKKKTFRRW